AENRRCRASCAARSRRGARPARAPGSSARRAGRWPWRRRTCGTGRACHRRGGGAPRSCGPATTWAPLLTTSKDESFETYQGLGDGSSGKSNSIPFGGRGGTGRRGGQPRRGCVGWTAGLAPSHLAASRRPSRGRASLPEVRRPPPRPPGRAPGVRRPPAGRPPPPPPPPRRPPPPAVPVSAPTVKPLPDDDDALREPAQPLTVRVAWALCGAVAAACGAYLFLAVRVGGSLSAAQQTGLAAE